MATTYSQMGLKSWNLSTDSFVYTDLDDNWSKINAHDHTTGKGVQIPTGGIQDGAVTANKLTSNAVTTAKISDSNVTSAKILDNAVTTQKILDDAITAAKIADGSILSNLLKPTINIVRASADTVAGTTNTDVTGVAVTLTPAVASFMWVIWAAECVGNGEMNVNTWLSVDGSDAADASGPYAHAFVAQESISYFARQQAVGMAKIPLTAVSHTIQLRCKRTGGSNPVTLDAQATGMIYLLTAQ